MTSDILFRRRVGAATLCTATFEEIEADRGARPQALTVVVSSRLAAGRHWCARREQRRGDIRARGLVCGPSLSGF